MTCPQPRVTYTGSTPGANTNITVLFSTVTAFPGKAMGAYGGIRRIGLDLAHSHNGTLNLYKSGDRGTNWSLVSTEAITAAATTTKKEFLVESLADYKLEWVNGGSAQTTWLVDILLGDDRGPSS